MHVQSVGDIQKRLDSFDAENFMAFRDNISRKKPNEFFLMNLTSLANLGRSQSKEELNQPATSEPIRK